jgi:hypothetical protein
MEVGLNGNRVAPHQIRVFNHEYIEANFQHGHTALASPEKPERTRLNASRFSPATCLPLNQREPKTKQKYRIPESQEL